MTANIIGVSTVLASALARALSFRLPNLFRSSNSGREMFSWQSFRILCADMLWG